MFSHSYIFSTSVNVPAQFFYFKFSAHASLGIPMLPCALVPNCQAAWRPWPKFSHEIGDQSQSGEGRQDDDAYYATDGSNMAAAEAKPPFHEALDSVLNSLCRKFILKEEQRLALRSFVDTTDFLLRYIRHRVRIRLAMNYVRRI